MIALRVLAYSLILLICIDAPILAAAPDSVFDVYMQAVLAEDWETAAAQWLPEELAASQRLGIQFSGVPLKVDCASPLFEYRAAINSGKVEIAVKDSFRDETRMVVKRIALTESGSQTLIATYLIVPREGRWYLTSRPWWETKGWRTLDTRYIRLRCHDSALVNEFALSEADRFVDSLLSLFLVPAEKRLVLEKEKILYILGDRGSVLKLSSYDVHGVSYLPVDAVITSHMPHEHELAHIIANFALTPIAMYTLPALQEGLAVACGGRWGKSARVSLELGVFVLESEFASIDSILTQRGFQEGTASSDLSYAVAGVLARCLLESQGWKGFSAIYRRLSGPNQFVFKLKAADVRDAVVGTTGQPWEALTRGCIGSGSMRRQRDAAIGPADSIPVGPLVFEQVSDHFALRVWETDEDYFIEAEGGGAASTTGILLSSDSVFQAGGYKSSLFFDHWPLEEYQSGIMGIVFDSVEAGVYDYRTNTLVAKFASGFSFGEAIWNPTARRIRFRVGRDVMPFDLRAMKMHLLSRSLRPIEGGTN